jgi:hypothetical protein
MKMRDQDQIYIMRAQTGLFQCDLRSFTRVDQYIPSLVSDKKRCQPTVRQRHRTAASKQCNIQHNCSVSNHIMNCFNSYAIVAEELLSSVNILKL